MSNTTRFTQGGSGTTIQALTILAVVFFRLSDLASIGKVFAKEARQIHFRKSTFILEETTVKKFWITCLADQDHLDVMQLRVIVEPTPPDKVIEMKWDRFRGFEEYPNTKSLYDMFLFSNLKAVDLVLIEDGDYGVDESRCGMRDSHLCLRFSVVANEMGWLFGKLRGGLVSKGQYFRWVLDATRDESEGETCKELKVKDFSRTPLGK